MVKRKSPRRTVPRRLRLTRRRRPNPEEPKPKIIDGVRVVPGRFAARGKWRVEADGQLYPARDTPEEAVEEYKRFKHADQQREQREAKYDEALRRFRVGRSTADDAVILFGGRAVSRTAGFRALRSMGFDTKTANRIWASVPTYFETSMSATLKLSSRLLSSAERARSSLRG